MRSWKRVDMVSSVGTSLVHIQKVWLKTRNRGKVVEPMNAIYIWNANLIGRLEINVKT